MAGYKVTNLVGTPTDYSMKEHWLALPENPDKPVDLLFLYPSSCMGGVISFRRRSSIVTTLSGHIPSNTHHPVHRFRAC